MAIQNWEELENVKQTGWVLGYKKKNYICYVENT